MPTIVPNNFFVKDSHNSTGSSIKILNISSSTNQAHPVEYRWAAYKAD